LLVGSERISGHYHHHNTGNNSSATVTYQRFKAIIPHIPAYFTGTGDLFAALLLGRTSAGCSLSEATSHTLQSLQSVLKYTLENSQPLEGSPSQSVTMKTHEIKLLQCHEYLVHPPNSTQLSIHMWTDSLET